MIVKRDIHDNVDLKLLIALDLIKKPLFSNRIRKFKIFMNLL